jgi:hypothetical protein
MRRLLLLATCILMATAAWADAIRERLGNSPKPLGDRLHGDHLPENVTMEWNLFDDRIDSTGSGS